MRILCFCIALSFIHVSGFAQYFQFSQFNYTPQRLNPALVSSSNYILCSVDFRNQSTAGGFSLTSNYVNASYPFINKKGQRWSGIGISLMDDRSGFEGIFNKQEVTVSYAVTRPLIRFHTLTLGLKILYLNQNVDLDKLLTGSQFVQDRGLDPSIDNGENANKWRQSDFTISSGLYWQNTDKKGTRTSYAGFSFFDFNRSQTLFENSSTQLNSTVVFMAGQRVWHNDKVTLFPEILYTTNANNNVLNAGLVTSYELKGFSKEMPERVDFISKYVVGKWVTLGVQLHRRNFSFGASYDFPVGKESAYNLGAIEIGLEWKKLTRPLKSKKPRKKRTPVEKQGEQVQPITTQDSVDVVEKQDITQAESVHKEDETLSERLRYKQDSVEARADVGPVAHEPMILDRATLHFNFEFNSSGIGPDSEKYLDELAKALNDNPDLTIRLEGHTDNVGSDKFNVKLSLERARAVKKYLESRGVESDRIIFDGKGKREPLNGNTTDAERALNRRVELTILYDN
jgi:type IX secretion system PorP/SprF family membrane protein